LAVVFVIVVKEFIDGALEAHALDRLDQHVLEVEVHGDLQVALILQVVAHHQPPHVHLLLVRFVGVFILSLAACLLPEPEHEAELHGVQLIEKLPRAGLARVRP
jgi:hypothetical protein